MAILNLWGVPYTVQKKRPELVPVVNISVEIEGSHMTIEIFYHMVLEDPPEDYSYAE